MLVKSAEFVMSNSDVAKCPKNRLAEYAFIGRSNVGKSSLINKTLYPILNKYFFRSVQEPLEYKEIKGIETFFHPVLNSLNPVDDKTFSFGTKTIKDTKNTKASKFKSTAIEIKDLKHENWRSKIKISFTK